MPLPVIAFSILLVLAHLALTRTPFGRQLYAVGSNLEAARKAGINTQRLLGSVYVISGLCAGIGCFLSLTQLGAVSPTFGTNREFAAIAAAVLGGTSLFGDRRSMRLGLNLLPYLVALSLIGLLLVVSTAFETPLPP